MKLKFKSTISLLVSLIMFNILIVNANVFPSKEKVTVEILYNANGDDFAENIVFDDGTRLSDYDYSVKYIATPRSSSKVQEYFDYAAWITRDGIISLSLDPNSAVRSNYSIKNKAWSILSSETEGFASSSNWQNTKVMKWQYDCHSSFAATKDYWNL